MKKLDLTYLNIPQEHAILEVLKNYGGQITTQTNGYLSYITTSGYSDTEEIVSASLFIVAPEINRQHQIFTIDIKDKYIKVLQWSLSNQSEYHELIANDDYSNFDDLIGDLLNNSLTKNILKLFIDQTELKISLKNKLKH